LTALLHDVGHGPFGHFFDDQYLAQFGITHEDIGAAIIENELGDLLRRVRRNPNGKLGPLEEIEPRHVAWLIRRPASEETSADARHDRTRLDDGQPDWLRKLRALFCGIYTVDNMDFVLRDAYMSGYNIRAFDLSRLIHYSFFTPAGLTIHARGLPTLIHFIETRANLFRTIYFHRTVRALDLALEELFAPTMKLLFPGNPLDHLEEYLRLTETSFLVDVQRWEVARDRERRELGQRWRQILCREITWKMACERTIHFHAGQSEQTTIFSEPALIEKRLRQRLPAELAELPLRIDVARHYHRPAAHLPTAGLNFVLDPADGMPRELNDVELFRSLPTSFSIVRVYAKTHEHDSLLNAALNSVLAAQADTRTNM
ncbi:MAG TPA: HD domain-containing protein, partial [Planctomycetaceae bacterium]|nr:HD domain-containing protein [Planctomycetaceae bacterium]